MNSPLPTQHFAQPLDALIRRTAQPLPEKPLPGQVLVAIAPTGTAEEYFELGFFQKRRVQEGRFYFVTQGDRTVLLPPCDLPVASHGRGRKIELSATVTGVKPGWERQVAAGLAFVPAALHVAPSGLQACQMPYDAFRAWMTAWLQGFIDIKSASGNNALAHFPALAAEAAQYLAVQSAQTWGLKTACTLKIKDDELRIPPLKIGPLRVFAADADDEMEVSIDLQIEAPDSADERALALAALVPDGELKEEISRRAQRWFREHCSLEDFCYHTDRVNTDLREVLSRYIEGEMHMKLVRPRVVCKPLFAVAFPREVEKTVECKVQPGETPVKVKHQLLLARLAHRSEAPSDEATRGPYGIALYRQALRSDPALKDIAEWIKDLLDRTTRAVFFKESYADVLIRFEELAEEIKERVTREMHGIGFEAAQLITLPQDEHLKHFLTGEFSFDTGDRDYQTNDTRTTFGLNISGTVKLPPSSLARVKHLIFPEIIDKATNTVSPSAKLEEKLGLAVAQEAVQVIRGLDPERLYMRFSARETDGTAEQLLRSAILRRLEGDEPQQFAGSDVVLNLVRSDTPITRIAAALRPPRSHHFSFELTNPGVVAEPITYHVSYRVARIADRGWSLFVEKCSHNDGKDEPGKARDILDAVEETFGQVARRFLLGLDRHTLLDPDQRMRDKLEYNAFAPAHQQVATEIGLQVALVDFHRDLTPSEIGAQSRTDKQRQLLEQQLKALQERRARLLGNLPLDAEEGEWAPLLPPDDAAITDIDKNIKAVRDELDTYSPGYEGYYKAVAESRVEVLPEPPRLTQMFVERPKPQLPDTKKSKDEPPSTETPGSSERTGDQSP